MGLDHRTAARWSRPPVPRPVVRHRGHLPALSRAGRRGGRLLVWEVLGDRPGHYRPATRCRSAPVPPRWLDEMARGTPRQANNPRVLSSLENRLNPVARPYPFFLGWRW